MGFNEMHLFFFIECFHKEVMNVAWCWTKTILLGLQTDMQKPIIELERIGSLLIEEIDTILICSCFDLELGETQGTGAEHQKILSEM